MFGRRKKTAVEDNPVPVRRRMPEYFPANYIMALWAEQNGILLDEVDVDDLLSLPLDAPAGKIQTHLRELAYDIIGAR